MGSICSTARGDLLLESKHADAAFAGEEGWALFWFDTPKKGKCLCAEYDKCNWPAVYIAVQANWKAKLQMARYRREGALWEEGLF